MMMGTQTGRKPIKAISLCLTQNCSLRCKYCFCGEKYRRNMPEEVAFKAIDWLLSPEVSGNQRRVEVDFWGGEPMMRLDLMRKVILHGKKTARRVDKQIRFGMTTNGVHLTPENVQLLDLLDVDYMISLDGRKETHDANRPLPNGEGSYDVIVKNLPHVFESRPMMKARLSVRAAIAGEYHLDMSHLFELGFKRLASSEVFEDCWTDETIEAYEQSIDKLGDWFIEQMRSGSDLKEVKILTDAFGRLLKPPKTAVSYLCGAGRAYVGVGIDGAIYPCHRFNDFSDERPWQEKEWALGHIDYGITRPGLREWDFLNPLDYHEATKKYTSSCRIPMHGCYFTNLELEGDTHQLSKLWVKAAEAATRTARRVYNTLAAERNEAFLHYLKSCLFRNTPQNKRSDISLPMRIDDDTAPKTCCRPQRPAQTNETLDMDLLRTTSVALQDCYRIIADQIAAKESVQRK
jgi:sulfatase maturation enzyme AslB (radical SAM superfamily)